MQLHRLLTGGPSELAFQTFPPVKDHPWLYIFHDLSLDNNNLLRKRHPVKRCFLWIVVQIKGFVLVLHEDSKCHEFRKLLTKPWYVCLGINFILWNTYLAKEGMGRREIGLWKYFTNAMNVWQVLTLCPLKSVNQLNLNSTIVYTSCTK